MISEIEYNNLIKEAVTKFGRETNLRQFHEELGELIVAVSHYIRGRNTIEDLAVEIVDAKMMIDVIKELFDVPDELLDKVKESQFNKMSMQRNQ